MHFAYSPAMCTPAANPSPRCFPTSIDASREFVGVSFGDRTLSERCLLIAKAFVRSPGASLPAMMASETELAGAYRFFNNPKVSPESLLFPHVQATLERLRDCLDWLCVHDTTEMAYAGTRKGLGPLQGKRRGYLAHAALAVAGGGLGPLGVLNLELLTRPDPPSPRRRKSSKRHKKRRVASYSVGPENEHSRWWRSVESVEARAKRKGLTRPIHLFDREGDSYLFIAMLIEHGCRFVLRMAHNRALVVKKGRKARYISDALRPLQTRSERDISISERDPKLRAPDALKKHAPRAERDVHLKISSTQLVLKRPDAAPDWLPSEIKVNVVHAYEPNPPPGETPVEWKLMTSESIQTKADVEHVVDLYRGRWVIEEFFKALKSGCAVLDREFEKAVALQNVLAMSIPIAWQMLALRTLARRDENAPAIAVLTQPQIELVVAASQQLPPRQRPPPNPTARQALLAIAALGGHLTRNGEPGWLTLARGLHQLRKLEASLSVWEHIRSRTVEFGVGS